MIYWYPTYVLLFPQLERGEDYQVKKPTQIGIEGGLNCNGYVELGE